MNWRKESAAFDRIWYNSTAPPYGNMLAGTWKIEMMTGWIPALKHHMKHIRYTGLFSIGKNKTGFQWGEFRVREKQGYSIMEYCRWPIKDEIVEVDIGVLLGKFYWRGKFKGYFWMTRVEGES